MSEHLGQSVRLERPKSWSVVMTHSHQHAAACENLTRQGFEHYCPMVGRRIRHARKIRDVLRPLFPGYIFVRIDRATHLWRPILSTIGVRSMIKQDGAPAVVEEGLIAALKARESGGVIVRPPVDFKAGQQIKLAGSALEGLVGTILELDEKDRITVLLDFLNRPVRVTLNASTGMAV